MVKYIKGDLFSHAASNVVLAHACNPFGQWGGGIAVHFRKRYPSAYEKYADFCSANASHPTSLLGKCLLVPSNGLYIACLFTSDFSCSPDQIVEYTSQSVSHLARQLASLPEVECEAGTPVVSMPQINSGIFNVPWERTESVLATCSSLRFHVYIL